MCALLSLSLVQSIYQIPENLRDCSADTPKAQECLKMVAAAISLCVGGMRREMESHNAEPEPKVNWKEPIAHESLAMHVDRYNVAKRNLAVQLTRDKTEKVRSAHFISFLLIVALGADNHLASL